MSAIAAVDTLNVEVSAPELVSTVPEPPVGHALPTPKSSPLLALLAFLLAGPGSVAMSLLTVTSLLHAMSGNSLALWGLIAGWATYLVVTPAVIAASHARGDWD